MLFRFCQLEKLSESELAPLEGYASDDPEATEDDEVQEVAAPASKKRKAKEVVAAGSQVLPVVKK